MKCTIKAIQYVGIDPGMDGTYPLAPIECATHPEWKGLNKDWMQHRRDVGSTGYQPTGQGHRAPTEAARAWSIHGSPPGARDRNGPPR